MKKNLNDFLAQAQPGDIISVRSEGWMGKLIRWVTESNVNHTALYVGNGLIIESTLGYGVRILPIEIYINDPRAQVFLSRIKQRVNVDSIVKYSYNFYGMKYNLIGQLGILAKFLVKKAGLNKYITFWGTNKINHVGLWCSEFIGEICLIEKIRFSDADVSYLSPAEIFTSDVLQTIEW